MISYRDSARTADDSESPVIGANAIKARIEVHDEASNSQVVRWKKETDRRDSDTAFGLARWFFEAPDIESRALTWSVVGHPLPEEGEARKAVEAPPEQHEICNWTIGSEDLVAALGERLTVDVPSSGTGPRLTPKQLERRIERLFRAAEDLRFEDGMESPFSRDLMALVRCYGEPVRELLTYWIVLQKASSEVAGEALRWLGAMEDGPSYQFRRWLLERCLDLPSATVRDGAALGVTAMDDPHAVPYLRKAVARERCAELRELLEQAVAQLEG